jgi:hypothetical protein
LVTEVTEGTVTEVTEGTVAEVTEGRVTEVTGGTEQASTQRNGETEDEAPIMVSHGHRSAAIGSLAQPGWWRGE